MICLFPGCPHPVFVEPCPNSEVPGVWIHLFCSLSHARLFTAWKQGDAFRMDDPLELGEGTAAWAEASRRSSARRDNVAALLDSRPMRSTPSQATVDWWGALPETPPDESLEIEGDVHRPTTDNMQRSWPCCRMSGCMYPVRIAPWSMVASSF